MNCPKCGAAIPNGKNFCVECGEHLPEQTQVRKCAKCGAAIPNGKNFCVECGEHLPEQTQVRKCAKCGAAIPNGKSFCVECGTPYAAKMTTQAPSGGMKNEGATPPSEAAVSPTPILSGSKWSYIFMGIAGIAILINLILLLISEFWLPELRGPIIIVGILVALIPLFAGFICMMAVRSKDGSVIPIVRLSALSKVVLFAGCGLALAINCVNFCWDSETTCKYQLSEMLDKVFTDRPVNGTFSWRTDIVVKDGEYLVPVRKMVRGREKAKANLYFKFQYNKSTGKKRIEPVDYNTRLHVQAAKEGKSRFVGWDLSDEEQEDIIRNFEKPNLN